MYACMGKGVTAEKNPNKATLRRIQKKALLLAKRVAANRAELGRTRRPLM